MEQGSTLPAVIDKCIKVDLNVRHPTVVLQMEYVRTHIEIPHCWRSYFRIIKLSIICASGSY